MHSLENKECRCDGLKCERACSQLVDSSAAGDANFQALTDAISHEINGAHDDFRNEAVSSPSSLCASDGSRNNLNDYVNVDNVSLPSLVSDDETNSDRASILSDDDETRFHEAVEQVQIALAADPDPDFSRPRLSDASLALHSLATFENSSETGCYGLGLFLNTDDDPWSQYSMKGAGHCNSVMEF